MLHFNTAMITFLLNIIVNEKLQIQKLKIFYKKD